MLLKNSLNEDENVGDMFFYPKCSSSFAQDFHSFHVYSGGTFYAHKRKKEKIKFHANSPRYDDLTSEQASRPRIRLYFVI